MIDRGPGIPAKVAAQIFEPFFTTHEYGTGLGLYLARTMCEANQATLEYVPVAGGGLFPHYAVRTSRRRGRALSQAGFTHVAFWLNVTNPTGQINS